MIPASASSSGKRPDASAVSSLARFRAVLSGVLDFLLPRHCPLCGESLPLGSPREVCPPCLEELERLRPPWCPCCGKPFASELTLAHSPGHRCADCREHPPAFDLARAIGPMEGRIRELVHLYKFQGKASIGRELGPRLGQLAQEELGEQLAGENVRVTHVPIAPARWRERGFDQSEILARRAAERLGLPFEALLERKKDSPPQTGLPGPQRRRNLQGVFGLRRKIDVQGARVLLVDDVLTTGSTASACARALKKGGAEAVWVVTVCTVAGGKWLPE